MLMLICVFTDEWVDYHLGLGFSDIYIYDNVDDSTPLLDWQKNDRKGDKRIHVIPYPGDMVQVPVYKDCARRVKKNGHTWVTFIDVDEFYVLKKHDNIIDFAKDHAAEGHVTVNWEMYGTSGRKTYELHPVTQRFECIHFTRRRAFVKSLIKVSTMGDIDEIRSPHIMPIADGAERLDTSGIPVRMSRHEGPRYDHSYLCGSADLLFYSRSQLILTLASFLTDLSFAATWQSSTTTTIVLMRSTFTNESVETCTTVMMQSWQTSQPMLSWVLTRGGSLFLPDSRRMTPRGRL